MNHSDPELLHEFNFILSILDSFESELNDQKSKFEKTHERLFLEVSNNPDLGLQTYSASLKLKGFKIKN